MSLFVLEMVFLSNLIGLLNSVYYFYLNFMGHLFNLNISVGASFHYFRKSIDRDTGEVLKKSTWM